MQLLPYALRIRVMREPNCRISPQSSRECAWSFRGIQPRRTRESLTELVGTARQSATRGVAILRYDTAFTGFLTRDFPSRGIHDCDRAARLDSTGRDWRLRKSGTHRRHIAAVFRR